MTIRAATLFRRPFWVWISDSKCIANEFIRLLCRHNVSRRNNVVRGKKSFGVKRIYFILAILNLHDVIYKKKKTVMLFSIEFAADVVYNSPALVIPTKIKKKKTLTSDFFFLNNICVYILYSVCSRFKVSIYIFLIDDE